MPTIQITAETAYCASQVQACALLAQIKADLDDHQVRYLGPSGPRWGAVGDLRHVVVLLQEIHSFLER